MEQNNSITQDLNFSPLPFKSREYSKRQKWGNIGVSCYNLKFPKVGVGVIVLKNGKILLGRRKGHHGAGKWALPGGHLEFGESLEACAKRETKEETNLDVRDIIKITFTIDFFEKENKHYATLFLLARKSSGELKLLEPEKCRGWKWFKWKERLKDEELFLPLKNLLKDGFDLNKFLERVQ